MFICVHPCPILVHTFGAAAQQAGISQPVLARHAYARGMEPPFSDETLAEELSFELKS